MNLISTNPGVAVMLLLSIIFTMVAAYRTLKRHKAEREFQKNYEYYEAQRTYWVHAGLLPDIDWDDPPSSFLVDKSPE